MAKPPPPLWLLAEVTHSCPLQCPYCSNPLDLIPKKDELDTENWLRVLHEARQIGAAQLGFSGGEPLVRKDLEVLIGEARKLGFYSNLITSGIGMDAERVERFRALGLDHIQVSFQADDAVLNDYLAGTNSFQHKLDMARAVKANGYPMVLCFVIHRQNIGQVRQMLDLAAELQADYVELATAQYEGWALLNRDHLLPTQAQVREAERIAHEYQAKLKGKMRIYYVVPDYYENRPKPCVGGWGRVFLAVAPDGLVLPCHSARGLPGLELHNVRERSIEWIWNESPGFNHFRGEGWMKEPCRTCDEREKDFGGCHCQAFKLTGDPTNADPTCAKSPHHHLVEKAIDTSELGLVPAKPMVFRQRNKRLEVKG